MGYNPSYPAARNSENGDVLALTVIDPLPTDTVLIITATGTFRTTVAQFVAAAGGGGGGGGDQIKRYDSDPNTEGVVPGDQTKGAVAYSKVAGAGPNYNWNPDTLTWE